MSGANRKGAGATRGQLVLVGVLALVLVGVIANNLRGGDGATAEAVAPESEPVASENAAPVAAPQAAAEPTSAEPVRPTGPFGEFAVDQDWPDPSLDQLIDFDPLATPAWVAAPADAETPAESMGLEELQQAQNAIIFVSEGVRVARIGDQEYHVGDAIGQFRITDISSAGIVLSDPEGNASDR